MREISMTFCKGTATALFACLTAAAVGAHAPAPAPAKAEAIVNRAVAYANQNGMDKLIQQTNQANGIFHVGAGSELYLFIYDQQGFVKAIGFNTAALVGKCRMDLKDPDGKMIIQEFIQTAQSKGKGWVDYKYPNPIGNSIESKSSYIVLSKGLILGCGIYKKE